MLLIYNVCIFFSQLKFIKIVPLKMERGGVLPGKLNNIYKLYNPIGPVQKM